MLTTDQCFDYLSSLHTTLWGDYLIEDPERRSLAAAWLAKQANAAAEHARAAARPALPERRETKTFYPPSYAPNAHEAAARKRAEEARTAFYT